MEEKASRSERNLTKDGGEMEVGCRKDDRCLKRQKCLSPEIERMRQLILVPAPDVQYREHGGCSHHQIQFLSSQHMKVWKEQP